MPLSHLFSQIVRIKNWSFDSGFKKAIVVGKPVISVGNLTMGGTGKTPILEALISWCEKNDIQCGVVSRGYGGTYKGVTKVDISQPNATRIYGDEPCMLKKLHPNTPIYLCGERVKAANALIENEQVRLILADDAFQHRALHRDLDIVIMDGTEPIKNYQPVPRGRAREPFSSLKRAKVIIINKVNLSDSKNLNAVKEKISQFSKKSLVLESNYILDGFLDMKSGERKQMNQNEKSLLVSGLGNPKSFENSVKSEGLNVLKHMEFRDHYSYTEADYKNILEQARSLKLKNIVTTQKDAVKLEKLIKSCDNVNWIVSNLKVSFISETESLYAKINQILS